MSPLAQRFPTDKDVTRMPQLARRLLQFNLDEELRRLRAQASWQRDTGRSSKTLIKYPDFHVVLVLMKANTRMNKHHVDGRFSIHALQGKIRVRIAEKVLEVSSGELIALDYGIPHEVEAVEESAFLLTISWPGGTKEERHAWKQSMLR
jgi:quercetin dioxygenase-like cupin family protein